MQVSEKLQDAVIKLTSALQTVESANELLARVKQEVKDDGLHSNAIIYGIKRNLARVKNPENIELQDEVYETIFQNELIK